MNTTSGSTLLRLLCLGAAPLLAAGAAHGQCTHQKILAGDRQSFDFFGGALGGYLDATTAAPRVLVGVGADDTAGGTNAGSVYSFGRIGGLWGPLTHFYAEDPQPNDFFGVSVACSDPFAIVGATGVDDNGAVYFFQRFGSVWVQQTKWIASGGQVGSDMGRCVTIDGEWAAAGMPLRDTDTSPGGGFTDVNAGHVVIFRRNADGTWFGAQGVDHTEGGIWTGHAADDNFGSSVSMKSGLLAVGAPDDENVNWPEDHGAVYLYRLNGAIWQETDRIVPSGADIDGHFGAAVSTDGSRVAVGTPEEDGTSLELPGLGSKSNCGAVFIYRVQDGQAVIEDKIFADDAHDDGGFGSSVQISGSYCVIAALDSNSAYVFRRQADGQWLQVSRLRDPDVATGDYASDVALIGDQILVGDQGDEEIFSEQTNAGAMYAYTRPAAAVASDSCDGATVITGQGTYTGCTYSASPRGATLCSGGPNGLGNDVWYSWTPQCSGMATIDTIGSDFDTILSIHWDCPGGLGGSNTLVCNDDGGAGGTSVVNFEYLAGSTYLIRIAGYSGEAGNFTLHVNEGGVPANNQCSNAQVISAGTYSFTTCRATTDVAVTSECHGPIDHDVWFRYNAGCDGRLIIDLCGSSFDTQVAVWAGFAGVLCPTTQAPYVCNDDRGTAPGGPGECSIAEEAVLTSRINIPSQAGYAYLIRVGGYAGHTGNATMTVSCTTACGPCDWDESGAIDSSDFFDFLGDFFAANADYNASGATDSSDFFDFLACFFTGCP